jgi:hypothetical protein
MPRLRSRLRKAEISVPVQARMGSTELTKFLYNRRVPGILIATCRYEARAEAPRHMALCYQRKTNAANIFERAGEWITSK